MVVILDYEKYLRPGVLILSADHTMMYVGGNYSLHCTARDGGRIKDTYDLVEVNGAIRAEESFSEPTEPRMQKPHTKK